jgi:hypothetical protein
MILMARRRRHHSGSSGFWGMLSKAITPLSFAAAFVPQLASKDTSTSAYTSLTSNTDRAKFLVNSISGRMTGFNPFPQYGTHSFTVNPSGVFNNYTYMGAGLMILGSVLPKGMGGKGLARKVGKGLFWGGVIGGFFDDPVRSGATQSNTTTYGDVPIGTYSRNTNAYSQ